MAKYRYGLDTVNGAFAVGHALPISRKQAVEICNMIRKKSLVNAKLLLEKVIAQKAVVPYSRYNDNIGHKHGIAAGRMPGKACKYILEVMKSAESNAQSKGFKVSNLVVRGVEVQQGGKAWHFGRFRRRRMKRTHVEFVLAEALAGSEKKVKENNKKAGVVQ